jgi:hypothetical protein
LQIAPVNICRVQAPLDHPSIDGFRLNRRRAALAAAAATALLAVVAVTPISDAQSSQPSQQGAADCRPEGQSVDLTGDVTTADRSTYVELPVAVAAGTTRIEVGYSWASNGPETDLDKTVVDLGLWDEDGPHATAGFRGWSGSRQGKVAEGQTPIFVQVDSAERGYVPGPVNAGTWYVELGFGAVHDAGATWHVTVTCRAPATGPVWTPDPVDPSYVARAEPGWYRADLHLHAFHSNPKGPDPAAMIEFARTAKLDVAPVTEYVTNTHWGQLGSTQRANPGLLLFPGREVITYFGHVIVLGETPSTVDYRQGFEGVDLRDIQRAAVGDGALFSIAHPTIFPGEALQAFCRGCEFRLADHVDWDLVDTLEVVTGPAVVDLSTFDRPPPGGSGIANPFVASAIELWESLLQQGHHITAVSGSDDKLGPDYGQTATMIHAESLSRPAIVDALRAGHAYVQTLGADGSPTYDIDAHTADGTHATFGDTLVGTAATLDVTVNGANAQTLVVSRDGTELQRIPVTSDPFSTSIPIDRDPAEGPLGTFWRVDVASDVALTAVGNPIFLADAQPPPKERGPVPTSAPVIPNFPSVAAAPTAASGDSGGAGGATVVAVMAAVVGAGIVTVVVVSRRPSRARRRG